ncbi:class I adenylate-forming enzyme family protein [Phreatobacter stygius]|uniref:class I adenylate-forming enzyme family protein n=1 Tax=Phreatobacter stygius TaxID=1940610 RepID=UPI001476D05D|nr:class I adenylate-forming enzyme family protein [Phreatobacter stygius]
MAEVVMPETLRDWMDHHAAARAGQPACIGPHGVISYAALHQQALAFAGAFRAHGLGKGDVIAVQLPNGLAFLQCYLAAGSIGAVLQTIHMPYRAADIEPLLRHARAKAVICLAEARDVSPAALVLSLRQSLPDLRLVVAVGPNAPDGAMAFEALASGPGTPPDDRPQPGDRFVLLYTSGTTAAPKGVPVPYARFLANARLSAAELGIDGSSVLLSAAPFSHLYGLFSINLALSAGAATAVLPAFTPVSLAAALDSHRPTGLFVAPAHLAGCLNEGLLTPDRLSSLRFVLISGSACPPELARALQDLMPEGKVCQLWGMSEMQAGSFTRPGDAEPVRLTSVGRASPGTELRVADGTEPLPVGTEGELQVRGISVFDGYLDNPSATAEAFSADGWFRTGDLARLDEHGHLTITGRSKEVINRGGVKFNPADVEALIARHPAVEICAIVPMPDPVLGERACCFVVLHAGAGIDLDKLRAWLARHDVAKTKWPERLELIDEMPMTPTRKIKKAELAKRVAGSG